MNKMCEQSQEIVDRCRKKLEALGNKLDAQRATLRNLRRMAAELAPEYENTKLPSDLPPEYQKELNDRLYEIDSISQDLTKSKSSARKMHKPKNMV